MPTPAPITIAPILGSFSFFGFFAWLALISFAHSLSGMGDGVSGSSRNDGIFEWAGGLYLFLVFVSCLPFMRGKLLTTTGGLAHGILMVFALAAFSEGGFNGFIILIPFFLFAAGWYALYKSRSGHSA
jgi:hypothetical protein